MVPSHRAPHGKVETGDPELENSLSHEATVERFHSTMEKCGSAGLPIEFDRRLRNGAVDKSTDLTDISSRRKKVRSVQVASPVRLFHKQ